MIRSEILEYAAAVGLTEAKVNAMTVPQKIDLLAAVGRAKQADSTTILANVMRRQQVGQLNAAKAMINDFEAATAAAPAS